MAKSRVLSLLFSFVFLLAASVAVAADPAPATAAPAKPLGVGDKLATLAVAGLDGKNAEIAVGKGLVAIAFFNTSCSACKAEMALLDAMSRQNKALRVVAVSVDAQGSKTTTPFVEASNYNKFEYFLDPTFAAAEKFGFSFSPGLVVVKDGSITMRHPGYMNRDEEAIAAAIMK